MTVSRESVPDVLIIGGGLSGLLVAERLRRRDVSSQLIEAGPAFSGRVPRNAGRFTAATAPLVTLDESRWRFRPRGLPFDWLRVRALGGRSLLWGGWCQRPDAQNFRDARALGASWPLTLAQLMPHVLAAERALGVVSLPIDPLFRQLTAKLGLALAPKRSAVLAPRARARTGLDLPQPGQLRTETVALKLLLEGGEIAGVEALDLRAGRTEVLRARQVVLALSPIETARLLLSSGIQGENGEVGKNLVDHLVASCLAILPHRAPKTSTQTRGALIPRFVNVDRKSRRDYRSGFCLEVLGPLPLESLGEAAVHSLEIGPREAKQRSFVVAHAIGEGHPFEGRRVTLDRRQRDSLGRPLPVVHLGWSDEQQAMARDMDEAAAAVVDALAPEGSRIIRLRDPLRPGGIAHEAGTARMGKSERDGVTDSHGAVFGVRGLFIADASIMPTALDRHPTLTVLALALRVADRVARDVARAR